MKTMFAIRDQFLDNDVNSITIQCALATVDREDIEVEDSSYMQIVMVKKVVRATSRAFLFLLNQFSILSEYSSTRTVSFH
jgi:hypothetical protein